jgi:hypothetical protein
MMQSFRALGGGVLVLLLMAGCGGPMGRAVHHYEDTRYPEALDALQALEDDARLYEPAARARYSLYRGLAHLAVGNAPAAGRWLGRARLEVDEDSERLSEVDKSRLESGWRSLGLMPGEAVVTE